jgi:hypothetical protein
MKYLNSNEIKDLMLKNEYSNLFYTESKIVFKYDLEDVVSGKPSTLSRIQMAQKIKIDNQDFYLVNDEFKDYYPSVMLLDANSPLITEVLESTKKYYSVEEEFERVKLAGVMTVGGTLNAKPITKPFSNQPEIQSKFESDVKNLINDHMKNYNKVFIESMSKYTKFSHLKEDSKDDADIQDKLNRTLSNAKLAINKESTSFDEVLSNIKKLTSVKYNEVETQRKEAYDLRMKEEAAERKKAADLKSFLATQEVKDYLIEKFGYYPVVEFKNDKVEVNFINKDDQTIDTLTFNTVETEIDFYNKKEDDFSYLYTRHIPDSEFESLNKDVHKKYFHAIYDLKDSVIINNKDDLPDFQYVWDKHGEKLPENRQTSLIADDKLTLSVAMKDNYSNEHIAAYVQDEFNETFKKKNKLKP